MMYGGLIPFCRSSWVLIFFRVPFQLAGPHQDPAQSEIDKRAREFVAAKRKLAEPQPLTSRSTVRVWPLAPPAAPLQSPPKAPSPFPAPTGSFRKRQVRSSRSVNVFSLFRGFFPISVRMSWYFVQKLDMDTPPRPPITSPLDPPSCYLHPAWAGGGAHQISASWPSVSYSVQLSSVFSCGFC